MEIFGVLNKKSREENGSKIESIKYSMEF